VSSIVTSEDKKWPNIELEAKSIDELIKEGSLLPPSLIKIDVEGEEGNVLLGAKDTILRFRPIIICEIHSSNSGRIVAALLEAYGYFCSVLGEAYSDWHIIARLEEGVEKRILAIHAG
jgi:hypothetical protein